MLILSLLAICFGLFLLYNSKKKVKANDPVKAALYKLSGTLVTTFGVLALLGAFTLRLFWAF